MDPLCTCAATDVSVIRAVFSWNSSTIWRLWPRPQFATPINLVLSPSGRNVLVQFVGWLFQPGLFNPRERTPDGYWIGILVGTWVGLEYFGEQKNFFSYLKSNADPYVVWPCLVAILHYLCRLVGFRGSRRIKNNSCCSEKERRRTLCLCTHIIQYVRRRWTAWLQDVWLRLSKLMTISGLHRLWVVDYWIV
jgi:hypothetical protein